jgi:hypothetical protein
MNWLPATVIPRRQWPAHIEALLRIAKALKMSIQEFFRGV